MNKKASWELQGERFGRLVVISEIEPEYSASGRRYTRYLCQCDCGNPFRTRTVNLLNSKSKSCGCIKKEYLEGLKAGKIKRYTNMDKPSLNGKTFGKLKVLKKFTPFMNQPNKRHKWECECECGAKVYASYNALVSGKVKSCNKCSTNETEV